MQDSIDIILRKIIAFAVIYEKPALMLLGRNMRKYIEMQMATVLNIKYI
jgi:hypothetical protein